MKRRGMAALAALVALLAGGCTRVALGIANGGIAPPDARTLKVSQALDPPRKRKSSEDFLCLSSITTPHPSPMIMPIRLLSKGL